MKDLLVHGSKITIKHNLGEEFEEGLDVIICTATLLGYTSTYWNSKEPENGGHYTFSFHKPGYQPFNLSFQINKEQEVIEFNVINHIGMDRLSNNNIPLKEMFDCCMKLL